MCGCAGSVYLVRCQHVREAFGVNPRPVLQLLLATISASLAGVSRAIQAASKGSASISPCTVATLAQGADLLPSFCSTTDGMRHICLTSTCWMAPHGCRQAWSIACVQA